MTTGLLFVAIQGFRFELGGRELFTILAKSIGQQGGPSPCLCPSTPVSDTEISKGIKLVKFLYLLLFQAGFFV